MVEAKKPSTRRTTSSRTTKPKTRNLGALFVESGAITRDQLRVAMSEKLKGQSIGEALVKQKFITEVQLIKTLEAKLGIEHVQLHKRPIGKDAISKISQDFAQKHIVLPIGVDSDAGEITVAMHDPMNYFVIDNIELSTGLTVKPVISTRDDILIAINKHYAAQMERDAKASGKSGDSKLDGTVVTLFNQILTSAVQLKASDLHIDPEADYVSIRYRVDGQLRRYRKIAKAVLPQLTARVKILSELDITQSRIPQDGRFSTMVGSSPVDLRVSILPTVEGEKIVIRILDLSDAQRSLNDLGFSRANAKTFSDLLKKPSGLILLTGPTGSGKSSTLYAAMKHLNNDSVNIMTVEDPVELQIEGINQVQVNAEAGLTFAAGLRSILRQDPNIIMIGEIRDKETAEIAIRSALTGHLVTSTLHTNSAVDAVPRLVDMGIEPYLVASSIRGVVAQRLVRKICADCRRKRRPTPAEQEVFKSRGNVIEAIYESPGCNSCQQTGYRGRITVHEIFTLDETMKQMLLQSGTTSDLKSYAVSQGMKFLIDDGLEKVKSGLTSLDEVMKIAADS